MPVINRTLVSTISPTNKRQFVWDDGKGAVKGFGLIVQPSGAMSYVFQYRNCEGQTRRLSIGKASNITAEQARQIAKGLAADVVKGSDPAGAKQSRRKALTVSQLLDEYLASTKFAEKANGTQTTDKSRIERHIKPLLGNAIADKLTKEQVRRALSDIAAGKTARDTKTGHRGRSIVKGGEGSARMAGRLLRAVLNWAVEEGFLSSNPVLGIKLGRDGVRTDILENAEQYERLFRAIDRQEQERRIKAPAADAIRLLALTGSRKSEITNLTWRQVDLKRGMLVLPPSSHKAGKATGQVREIALPSSAQAIIARQPGGNPDSLVFQSTIEGAPISLSKPWQRVRDEAGLPETLNLHGLRHSLGSLMAVQGAEAAQIMVALGHSQLETTKRYIHFAKDARSALIEKHTAGISAALEGRESAPVVELESSRSK